MAKPMVVSKKVSYSVRELRDDLHDLLKAKDARFTSPVVLDVNDDGTITVRTMKLGPLTKRVLKSFA